MTTTAGAATPAELETRFCALAAAGDLEGLTRLYAADAVVSLPRGREAAGHDAIRTAFAEALTRGARWPEPDSVRVIDSGALAMTTSTSADGVVGTQVARREPDGSWVWVRDGSHLRSPVVADLLGAA
jgi:ketosteroid isomerase-like protein